MARILLLNGPNLNLLGTREPDVYGATRLEDIEANCIELADELGHQLDCYQSNAEHDLIDRVQRAATDGVAFIVFNPGGFTHTSVALRDAFLAVDVPFIEVHLSNIHAREDFRQNSYVSDIALGVISGLGAQGYELALQAAVNYLQSSGSGDGN